MADSGGIRAGRAYVEMGIVDKALKDGLDAAAGRVKAFGAGLAKVGAGIAAFGGAGLGFLAAGLPGLVESSGQLLKMSQRTGIAIESLSELSFAAARSGTDLEGMEGAVRKMQKFLHEAAQGSKEATKTLDDLGLKMDALAGMNAEQQLEAVAAAITRVGNASDKAALAQTILGKSGTMSIPLLANMTALREEAKRLGLTLDESTVRSAAAFGGAMARLKLQIGAVYTALAGALVPGLDALVRMTQPVLSGVIGFVKEHGEWVRVAGATSAALLALGTSMAVLGGAVRLAGVGFGGLAGVVLTLLSPIRLLGGLLMSLGGAVVWQAAAAGVGLFKLAILGLTGAFSLVQTVAVASVGAIATAWEAMMAMVAFSKATFAGLSVSIFTASGIARVAILGVALAARFAVIAMVLQWTGGAGLMTAATLGLAAAVLTTKAGIMALGVAQVVMAKIVAGVQLAIAAFQAWVNVVISLIGFISSGQWLNAIFAAVAAFGPLIAILWNIYGFMKLGEELAAGWVKFKDAAVGAVTSASQAALGLGTRAFTAVKDAALIAWQAIKENAAVAWESVKTTALQAYDAISAAIRRGDWQSAFAVAVTGINLEWQKLRGFLETTWIELKAFIIDKGSGIATDLSGIWTDIEIAWAKTMHSMGQMWKAFSFVVRNTWDLTAGTLQMDAERVAKATMNLLNPEAAMKAEEIQVKQEAAQKKDQAKKQREALGLPPEAELPAAMEEIDPELQKKINEIHARAQERRDAILGFNKGVQGGKAGELADAEARTAAAVEDAKARFAEARGLAMPSWDVRSPNFIGPQFEGLKKGTDEMDRAAAKAETIGTFTASIAGGLGAKSLDQQQVDILKAIDQHIKDGLKMKPAVA